jgi:hypothetical protein
VPLTADRPANIKDRYVGDTNIRFGGFRPGRSGACEARLFLFTGQAHSGDELPMKLVAACDLQEAMIYMRKSHPDVDILRVEFVALIEMVSGSPLN